MYPNSYSKLFEKAKAFVGETRGEKVLTLISCGFDACEYEYECVFPCHKHSAFDILSILL